MHKTVTGAATPVTGYTKARGEVALHGPLGAVSGDTFNRILVFRVNFKRKLNSVAPSRYAATHELGGAICVHQKKTKK